MNSLVKNVFLILMGSTAALVLYFILFGSFDFAGVHIDLPASVGYTYGNRNWQGALWLAAHSLETPIGRYYYEYCYLPNIHANDFVDEALKGTPAGFGVNYQSTDSDLTVNSGNPNAAYDTYDFSGVADHWSTGWR